MVATNNISSTTTTDFTNQVPDFIVESKSLDVASGTNEETYVYFDEAVERFGYYSKIPEIYSAINAMATWAFGAGWSTENRQLEQELKHVTGMGNYNN